MQGLPHPMRVSIIGKGGLVRRRRWWRPPATCGALTPLWLLTTPGSPRLLPGRGSNLIYCGRCPGRGGGRTHSLGATGRGRTLSCGLPSPRLTYNGESSQYKSISCGVPQCSILGQLLFLVYINDLCALCKHTTPILFADYTNSFCNGTDLQEMKTFINDELAQISQWLKVNKLSLNVKRKTCMLFTKSRNMPLKLNIVIDNESIGEVRRTKFLGVFIDKRLNWKDIPIYLEKYLEE